MHHLEYTHERNGHRHHFAPSIRKLTRAQWRSLCCTPQWERLKGASGDKLAMRALTLLTHGRETLHNTIRGDHGLPNYY